VGGGVSTTAVVPAPSLRNDLAAGWRHFVTRLRMTARDPFAVGLLAFAGAVTVPLWGGPVGIWLGIGPLFARQHPWPGGVVTFNGPVPTALKLAVLFPRLEIVFAQVMGAALVAGALGQGAPRRRWPVAPAPAMPALPLGRCSRVVADVLAVSLYVLIARTLVLWLGGVRLGRMLFGHHPWLAMYPEVARLVMTHLPTAAPPSPPLAYASSFAVNTVLGTLLSFPLVLA